MKMYVFMYVFANLSVWSFFKLSVCFCVWLFVWVSASVSGWLSKCFFGFFYVIVCLLIFYLPVCLPVWSWVCLMFCLFGWLDSCLKRLRLFLSIYNYYISVCPLVGLLGILCVIYHFFASDVLSGKRDRQYVIILKLIYSCLIYKVYLYNLKKLFTFYIILFKWIRSTFIWLKKKKIFRKTLFDIVPRECIHLSRYVLH